MFIVGLAQRIPVTVLCSLVRGILHMYKALNGLGFVCFSKILHTRTFFNCLRKLLLCFRGAGGTALVDRCRVRSTRKEYMLARSSNIGQEQEGVVERSTHVWKRHRYGDG